MIWIAIGIVYALVVFISLVGVSMIEAAEDAINKRIEREKNHVANQFWTLRVQLNETRQQAGLPPINVQRPLPDDEGGGWTIEDQQDFIRKVVEGKS